MSLCQVPALSCVSEYQCVDEHVETEVASSATHYGAGRKYPPRCSPSLEGACTCSEGTKSVTNGLRVCKCGGGKWSEFVSCSPRTGYLSDSAPFSSHPPPARTSMKLLALLSLLALMLAQEVRTASLPETEREPEGDQPHGEGDSYAVLQLGDYVLSLDNYDQVIDLSNYDELIDYREQLPKVRGMQQTHCIPCKKLGA